MKDEFFLDLDLEKDCVQKFLSYKKEKGSHECGPFFMSFSDEVGRGPLAGPVVASTVTLFFKDSPELSLKKLTAFYDYLKDIGVKDSKKITAKKRHSILEKLFIPLESFFSHLPIDENPASEKILSYSYGKCIVIPGFGGHLEIMFSVSLANSRYIEKENIHNASLHCMDQSFSHGLQEYYKFLKPENNLGGISFIDGKFTPRAEWGRGRFGSYYTKAFTKGDQRILGISLSSVLAKEFRDEYMKKLDRVYPAYGLAKHMGYPTKFHRQALKEEGASPIHRRNFSGVL